MPVLKPDTTAGFRPTLNVGEDIGLPAAECLRLDGILETRVLSTQLHQIVLGMARIRNAVSSFRLEGETVQLDRARQLLEGKAPESPSETGVLQLAEAYTRLAAGELPELSTAGLLRLHRRLFDGAMRPDWVGAFKTEQNQIENVGSGTVRFLPTPPERTEEELTRLFEWFKDVRFTYLPPVVAALFFAEFQAIHPFDDGNGRTGRFLNLALLKMLGCEKAPLIPLDTRFFRTSDSYYEFLATTNGGQDYHHWTRYFVRETKEAYRAASRQANLGPLISGFSRESTRSILRWILAGSGDWFSRSSFPNPRKYSQPALWSALDELRRKGVIEAKGERRGRRYRLRSRFLADVYARRF